MSLLDQLQQNEQIAQWLEQYRQLQSTERLAIKIGVTCFVVVILFFVMINPFLNSKSKAEQQLQQAQQVYQNAQELVPQILQAKKSGAAGSANSQQSLRNLFNLYSQSNSVKAISSNEQNDILTVQGKAQGFENIIKMVAQLQDKEGIYVESLQIGHTEQLGKVDYMIRFQGNFNAV